MCTAVEITLHRSFSFSSIRGPRKEDQEAIDLAWKEEKQRINSDPSGSQSYSAIKNGHE